MDGRRLRLAALVLAAGAGSRFSDEPGTKPLVDIDGEPMLARVLRSVRVFGPAATVVVLGSGADAIERAIDWQDEIRVRNHAPERGLASSLGVGIDMLRALPLDIEGVFIVLGDQPLLDAAVMGSLAGAAASGRPGERPLIAPRYAEQPGPRNPVLLLRPAWPPARRTQWRPRPLAADGRAAATRADVSVAGRMPDVDQPEDKSAARALARADRAAPSQDRARRLPAALLA